MAYNGLAPANIREELIFSISDPVPPVVSIQNFYEDEAYTLFDALTEVFPGKGGDIGSIFFMIPDTIDLSRYTFKVMTKDYDVINQVTFPFISLRTYPEQW